jgi:hypothetical protein
MIAFAADSPSVLFLDQSRPLSSAIKAFLEKLSFTPLNLIKDIYKIQLFSLLLNNPRLYITVIVSPDFIGPENGFLLLYSPFKILFCLLYTSKSILFRNRRFSAGYIVIISSFLKGSPNSIIAIL